MKYIFCFLIIMTGIGFAQESDTLTADDNTEVILNEQQINGSELLIRDDVSNLPLSNSYDYYENPLETPGSFKLLGIKKKVSGNYSFGSTEGLNFSSMTLPLQLQNKRDEEFETFLMILGIAQTAAVGYAAYEHIRKFGLHD